MKKMKISMILNIIITILVTIGSVFMFTGFKFMPDNTMLEASKLSMFKFYTVDSNILTGIISLIMAIWEWKYLKNKIKIIPQKIVLLKFIATSAITLTFIVTALFLAPQYGLYAMYNNNNLFFHLFVPILSIISFLFFEENKNSYKSAILGIIPMFLYSIYYTTNIVIHMKTSGITFQYDFYGFLQGNIKNIFFVIPIMLFLSYLISIVLLYFNKKLSNKKENI